MKNLVFSLVVIIFLTGCQKDLFVNNEAVRSELVRQPIPDKSEIQAVLNGTLKSGVINSNEPVLVQIFALSSDLYEIGENYAIKYLVYYEISQDGCRNKLITIRQQFELVDGVLGEYQISDSYEVGCPYPYSKEFFVPTSQNVEQISFFFRFNNGEQFAYFGKWGSSKVSLPNIADGYWQLQINYNDGDIEQSFISDQIDFDDDYQINLRLNLKKENIIAKVEIERASLVNVYSISFRSWSEETGEYLYMNYPVYREDGMPQIISFSLFFKPTGMYVCGINGCCYINLAEEQDGDLSILEENGITIYKIN